MKNLLSRTSGVIYGSSFSPLGANFIHFDSEWRKENRVNFWKFDTITY